MIIKSTYKGVGVIRRISISLIVWLIILILLFTSSGGGGHPLTPPPDPPKVRADLILITLQYRK